LIAMDRFRMLVSTKAFGGHVHTISNEAGAGRRRRRIHSRPCNVAATRMNACAAG
jgi:hypothetical protein